MSKFKSRNLHSGSKKGPTVTKPSQAIAIMLSERQQSLKKAEYRPKGRLNGGVKL